MSFEPVSDSCCCLSALSSKVLLSVYIAWLTSELCLMVPMLIRKVQTTVGCSTMEEFLTLDLALYVSNSVTIYFLNTYITS